MLDGLYYLNLISYNKEVYIGPMIEFKPLKLGRNGCAARSHDTTMFNAPRPAQNRYQTTGALGGSFVDSNPLSSSAYDGYDPWSGTTTPPTAPEQSTFSRIIGELLRLLANTMVDEVLRLSI
jgi:hypothetical protein